MKEFLEKRWWQGVGGIAGIIALLLVVLERLDQISMLGLSVGLNIIFAAGLVALAFWVSKWKRKYEDANKRIEKIRGLLGETREETKRKRVFLPDPSDIGKLGIDNACLTELYGQAHGRAIAKYHDAKLKRVSILVHPYQHDRASIHFNFYSRWADRLCTYIVSEVGDMEESLPHAPAEGEHKRVAFDELPWITDANWPQFLKKSCEKVGPLPAAPWTKYQLWADAGLKPQWGISFEDGVTGKEFNFSWDGKGDPILWEAVGE